MFVSPPPPANSCVEPFAPAGWCLETGPWGGEGYTGSRGWGPVRGSVPSVHMRAQQDGSDPKARIKALTRDQAVSSLL